MKGMEYNRVHTALAMALGEVLQLRRFLEARAHALRAEADKIEQYLRELPQETSEWKAVVEAESRGEGR